MKTIEKDSFSCFKTIMQGKRTFSGIYTLNERFKIYRKQWYMQLQ